MTIRGTLLGCCAGSAMILSACSSGQLARPEGPAVISDAKEVEAATIELKCGPAPMRAQVAPIVGAVAAIGVDFAVDMVSKLLKDAQAKRNAAWSATGVAAGCIPAAGAPVQGELTLRRSVVKADGAQPTPGFELTGSITFTRIVGKNAKGEAADMLELSFEPSSMTYGRTAAPTRGSGRKHVIVLLAFSSTSPLGGKPVTGDETLPLALRLDLGTLRDRQSYDASLLGHARGITSIPAGDLGSKLALTAIVVESENEILALRSLSDTFDGHKDDLSAAIRAALGIKDKQ